jgi:hypothetical protein
VTASAVPIFMRALRDGFAALFSDAQVSLGVHLDETPGARVWVGYDDPSLTSAASSARSRQSLATMGTRSRDEAGEVSCAVFVELGDSDMDAALAEAESMVDAIGGWLAHATFQDLPHFTKVLFGDSTQWLMDRTDYGAAVLVQFAVGFTARIHP